MINYKIRSLVFVLLSMFFAASNPAQGEESVKIGFVNIKSIFRDYQKVKQMEDKIRQETEAEYAKIKELKEQVKQLQEEIPLYRPGSKIRTRKEKELTEKLFEIKYKEARANHFFGQKLKIGIEQVYREVVEEIEDYARKNNFFMVLRVADADFFSAKTPEALRMEIHTRDVLYWGKKFDITHLIISQMNKRYQAQMKSFKKPTTSK